jgi:hypothetical protein
MEIDSNTIFCACKRRLAVNVSLFFFTPDIVTYLMVPETFKAPMFTFKYTDCRYAKQFGAQFNGCKWEKEENYVIQVNYYFVP